MDVKVLKKMVDYKDKNGEDKKALNFYLKVGDLLVPIEIKYFADKKTGVDNTYQRRKGAMEACAEWLPDKN